MPFIPSEPEVEKASGKHDDVGNINGIIKCWKRLSTAVMSPAGKGRDDSARRIIKYEQVSNNECFESSPEDKLETHRGGRYETSDSARAYHSHPLDKEMSKRNHKSSSASSSKYGEPSPRNVLDFGAGQLSDSSRSSTSSYSPLGGTARGNVGTLAPVKEVLTKYDTCTSCSELHNDVEDEEECEDDSDSEDGWEDSPLLEKEKDEAEILSRGVSPMAPFVSRDETADIESSDAAPVRAQDERILSRVKLSINRVADAIAKSNNKINIGRHMLRIREILTAKEDRTGSGVYRCRSEPANYNVALKSFSVNDQCEQKIEKLIRIFNEIEMLEELRHEKNAVHIVTSAFQQSPIEFDGRPSLEYSAPSPGVGRNSSDSTPDGNISVMMMMEWCGGGSLADLILKQEAASGARSFAHAEMLPERTIINVARAICNPLIKMHNRYGILVTLAIPSLCWDPLVAYSHLISRD